LTFIKSQPFRPHREEGIEREERKNWQFLPSRWPGKSSALPGETFLRLVFSSALPIFSSARPIFSSARFIFSSARPIFSSARFIFSSALPKKSFSLPEKTSAKPGKCFFRLGGGKNLPHLARREAVFTVT